MTDRLARLQEYTRRYGHPAGHAAVVLALVEIAKAARVVNGDGVGEFDTRTASALFPLRTALSVLDDREAGEPRD